VSFKDELKRVAGMMMREKKRTRRKMRGKPWYGVFKRI
jgi:hypothetical protein